jgi:hypothetical protein
MPRIRLDALDGRSVDSAIRDGADPTFQSSLTLQNIVPGKHIRFQVEALGEFPSPDIPEEAYMPLLIKGLAVAIPPGWKILDQENLKIRRYVHPFTGEPIQIDGEDLYVVIDGATRKHKHSEIPESRDAWFLPGGTRIWVEAHAPDYEPYPAPPPTHPILQKYSKFRALAPQNFDFMPPLFQEAWKFWRVRESDEDPYCLGDWMWGSDPFIPTWWNQETPVPPRFGHDPIKGDAYGLLWYGMIPWGDVWGANHYASVGHCLAEYILTGDVACWKMAVILWRCHAQSFFITTGRYRGASVDEKVGGGEAGGEYPSDSRTPKQSHDWSADNVLAVALAAGDPSALDFLDAIQRRWEGSNARNIWPAHWGSRQACNFTRTGRFLRDVLGLQKRELVRRHVADFLLEQDEHENKPLPLLPHGMRDPANPTEPAFHWVNAGVKHTVQASPWQDAEFNAELLAADIDEPTRTRILGMAEKQIDRFIRVDSNGLAVITFDAPDVWDRSKDTFLYQSTQAGWWYSCVWLVRHFTGNAAKYDPILKAIVKTAETRWKRDWAHAIGGGSAFVKDCGEKDLYGPGLPIFWPRPVAQPVEP